MIIVLLLLFRKLIITSTTPLATTQTTTNNTWSWWKSDPSNLNEETNPLIGNGFIITEIYGTEKDKKIDERYFIVVINNYDNNLATKGDTICAMLVNYEFFENITIVIPKEQIVEEFVENSLNHFFH